MKKVQKVKLILKLQEFSYEIQLLFIKEMIGKRC